MADVKKQQEAKVAEVKKAVEEKLAANEAFKLDVDGIFGVDWYLYFLRF